MSKPSSIFVLRVYEKSEHSLFLKKHWIYVNSSCYSI